MIPAGSFSNVEALKKAMGCVYKSIYTNIHICIYIRMYICVYKRGLRDPSHMHSGEKKTTAAGAFEIERQTYGRL